MVIAYRGIYRRGRKDISTNIKHDPSSQYTSRFHASELPARRNPALKAYETAVWGVIGLAVFLEHICLALNKIEGDEWISSQQNSQKKWGGRMWEQVWIWVSLNLLGS